VDRLEKHRDQRPEVGLAGVAVYAAGVEPVFSIFVAAAEFVGLEYIRPALFA
jgi:hypothetical protein